MFNWFFGYHVPAWRVFVGALAGVAMFFVVTFSAFSVAFYYEQKHSCSVVEDAAGVDTKWAGPNLWADCYVRIDEDTWVTLDKWRGEVD